MLFGVFDVLGAISYDPLVKIDLGPIEISPHGIGIAVGFLIGAWFMLPRARPRGIRDDQSYALFTRAAIGAVIGARVAYVLNHPGDYDSIGEALQIWKGGISLLGGFFGAILLAMPKIRSFRLSFWKVMDSAAPGMALGVTVGRIGDLIVADHLGKTTSFFLGYKCPPLGVETASPCAPTDFASRTPGAVVHQTALYDMIFAGILLVILLLLAQSMRSGRAGRPLRSGHAGRKDRFDGFFVCVFGFGYGIARIIEDFLREDVRRLGLTGSQWTAVATVLVCAYVLFVRRRTPKWGRWDEPPPQTPPAEEPATIAGDDAVTAPPTLDESRAEED